MSERIFADTNLFIRIFAKDDPKQLNHVLALLRRAERGEFTLVTNVPVIAEIVWVMEGKGSSRDVVRDSIWALLNTKGVQVDHPNLVGQAIDIYARKNIDFIDAYSICWMQANGITTAYTFDRRHFSRVAGIDVKVPGK
jgi:predicted nucleic-acid-binding protein